MINTHEIDLSAMEFEQLRNNTYIILQLNDIEALDYILLRQTDAGLSMMTQVKEIIENEGLKEGYALITLNKLMSQNVKEIKIFVFKIYA